ncbi:hypothetical protein BC351_28950 [Paenibacillus ferrarius]|uniref:Uncharacterized protein n=1 Tax=Paenibacillus ferrarius TaxID=1469647 RepID=A0A1V4HHC5_9BACL|nr:AAA family ATPase [Paenibacillus ferrarius]OPH56199.1 hypothetical protein BC351_28950 [Paenibacillus ferrarius]
MFLAELKIWNFRKYGSGEQDPGTNKVKPGLNLTFNAGLNLIVGENDSGKTAIIDAIKLVLTTHSNDFIKLEYDDFHMPVGKTNEEDRTNTLEIQCLFRDIKPHEAKNFLEWLSIESDGAQQKYYLKVFLKGIRKRRRVFYDVKAGTDDEGSQMNSEARAMLKTTYLKPLRDAESELAPRKNSRLSHILDNHQAFDDKEAHYLIQAMEQANKAILHYFEGFDGQKDIEDQNGKQLLVQINTYLKEFTPINTPLNSLFSITDMKLKTILEKLSLELSLNKSGLGSHNLLFIAVELLLLNRENYSGLKVALIEEIEAHIHPQAQLRLIEFLQLESERLGIQLILTTHSTVLASKVSLKNLILCNNALCFPMNSESTLLEEGDYSFLERFLDSTKANLFFAKGVILVEGDAEHLLLPTIAEIIDRPLSRYGTSLVNVSSTAFLRYCKIFQRQDESKGKMNIPVAVVTDNDIKPNLYKTVDADATTQAEIDPEANRKRKIEYYSGQSVKAFVSSLWTLEYDLAAGGNLTKEFYRAVLYAKRIQGSERYGLTPEKQKECDEEVESSFVQWQQEGKSSDEIAFEVYQGIMLKRGNKVSKAIVAQCLAKILHEQPDKVTLKSKIIGDQKLKYIVEAIQYATSGTQGDL